MLSAASPIARYYSAAMRGGQWSDARDRAARVGPVVRRCRARAAQTQSFAGPVLSLAPVSLLPETSFDPSELDPSSAMALSELASFRCAETRCSEGVQLAERAAELAPGNARVLAGTASVQLQAGLCSQAAVTQQRALEVLPERAPLGLRKQLQSRLGDYVRCAGR